MDKQQYLQELENLQRFIAFYCQKKHLQGSENLCEECRNLYLYAKKSLDQCTMDPKPKCRNCPEPCYEKREWKKMAQVMRFSGISLGYDKAKKKLFSFTKVFTIKK